MRYESANRWSRIFEFSNPTGVDQIAFVNKLTNYTPEISMKDGTSNIYQSYTTCNYNDNIIILIIFLFNYKWYIFNRI